MAWFNSPFQIASLVSFHENPYDSTVSMMSSLICIVAKSSVTAQKSSYVSLCSDSSLKRFSTLTKLMFEASESQTIPWLFRLFEQSLRAIVEWSSDSNPLS